MPRRDKAKYTEKQERKADHIAEGYKESSVSGKEVERRAWGHREQGRVSERKPVGLAKG